MTCTHRWLLPEPNGPFCEGVCRACGVTRRFMNYEESPDYLIERGLGIVSNFAMARKKPSGWQQKARAEKAEKERAK